MVVKSQLSTIAVEPMELISWKDFKKEYLHREDHFKYEWVRGVVEKTPRSMDYTQFKFVTRLNKFLALLGIAGEFIMEGDTFFAGAHRRPDLAFYTEEQIELASQGTPPVPQFVIEVISKNDQKEKVNKKMQDYRAAEVPIVWQVYKITKEVHVFRGKQMTICTGDDICSAEPVIPGFKLSAKEVLA